ncbi:hypothetical protein B0A49_08595 [Cryomyces minteri]|uniref:RNase III domain-containing protein n=1 Tax=Cryomyces minteri TaxID=331657 RepID=A0A4U0WF86_9PEZI|nr:hypothetical protein B0A49_08595 [Cryomyces minteri]
MVAPVRSRPRPKNNNDFRVNEDPREFDNAYRRILGDQGDKILTEEVKWLAVTHKSFDQGRRGFNDRLAFLGKRIVDLQTSLALLNSPKSRQQAEAHSAGDPHGRTPFRHAALEGLEGLTPFAKAQATDKRRMAQLAEQYGLGRVMRWKPRKADNLQTSGVETVLAHTVYSIVGAVALQKGGEVANNVVRQRILRPLGL